MSVSVLLNLGNGVLVLCNKPDINSKTPAGQAVAPRPRRPLLRMPPAIGMWGYAPVRITGALVLTLSCHDVIERLLLYRLRNYAVFTLRDRRYDRYDRAV